MTIHSMVCLTSFDPEAEPMVTASGTPTTVKKFGSLDELAGMKIKGLNDGQ